MHFDAFQCLPPANWFITSFTATSAVLVRRANILTIPCVFHYFYVFLTHAFQSTACRRCASGWVLNYTAVALLQQQQPLGHASNASLTHGSNASMLASASPCSPCPPHFVGAPDGSGCEFSGHFDLRDGENEENDKKEEAGRKSQKQKESPQHMHFDLSALRTQPLSATVRFLLPKLGQMGHLVTIVLILSNILLKIPSW